MTAWVKVVDHMPLTARPSNGLKNDGWAVCFILISSAMVDARRTSSPARANGLVHV
jgi:hypothetical protein